MITDLHIYLDGITREVGFCTASALAGIHIYSSRRSHSIVNTALKFERVIGISGSHRAPRSMPYLELARQVTQRTYMTQINLSQVVLVKWIWRALIDLQLVVSYVVLFNRFYSIWWAHKGNSQTSVCLPAVKVLTLNNATEPYTNEQN